MTPEVVAYAMLFMAIAHAALLAVIAQHVARSLGRQLERISREICGMSYGMQDRAGARKTLDSYHHSDIISIQREALDVLRELRRESKLLRRPDGRPAVIDDGKINPEARRAIERLAPAPINERYVKTRNTAESEQVVRDYNGFNASAREALRAYYGEADEHERDAAYLAAFGRSVADDPCLSRADPGSAKPECEEAPSTLPSRAEPQRSGGPETGVSGPPTGSDREPSSEPGSDSN